MTIVPKTRSEVHEFYDQCYTGNVRWKNLTWFPCPRDKGRQDVFHIADDFYQLSEGYKMFWYRSSSNARRDKEEESFHQTNPNDFSQKVWLMFTLSAEEINSDTSWFPWILNEKSETRFDKIVRIFKEQIKPRELYIKVKLVTEATAVDLRDSLTDPSTVALFWIGHASPTINLVGFSLQGVVLDYNGSNVADIFKNIHPNVRWVSIIGCYSERMIEEYKRDGFYKFNPLLEINGYDGIAVLSYVLPDFTKRAHSFLRNEELDYFICDWEQEIKQTYDLSGFFIRVSRMPSWSRSNIVITVNKHYLGFLSKDEESVQIWVPDEISTKMIEAVQVDLSIHQLLLEKLKIESVDRSHQWEVMSNKYGVPYGKDRNVYRISSTEEIVRTNKPSDCLTW